MANEHFWDNGIAQRSTEIEYKLRYVDMEGKTIDTVMTTLEKACGVFEKLKGSKNVPKCELIHVVGEEEIVQQKFEFQVMDINGTKILL